MVNLDIFLVCIPCFIYVHGCLIRIGVNCSLYVSR